MKASVPPLACLGVRGVRKCKELLLFPCGVSIKTQAGWWTLLSVSAACPCFPTSLSAEFLLLENSPPHHRHAAAPLPGRDEGWAPAPRAVSKILDFLWHRLRPAWMNLTWAPQTETSLAWKELHPFATTSIASLTVSTVIPNGAPHPKVMGTLSCISTKKGWDFLTNNRNDPLNLREEKLPWSALCLWVWRTGKYSQCPATSFMIHLHK